METQKIKTALVILNWNGKNWLEKFLPNILIFSKDVNIFLVDNASSDDSVSFVEEYYSKVTIISNKINCGFAKGYNNSLRYINAEYYILLNSDIEVSKGWISPLIKLMDADINIAACQPKILDFNNKEYFEYAGASGGYIDNLGYPFCRGRIFDNIERDNGQYNDKAEIFWATGACIVVRSSVFWEVNGFDEDFFAHQEEIDLCWRLKNNGYKIMVEPKSFVYHVGGGTLAVGSPLKTFLNFRNNLFMLFKNLTLNQLLYVLPLRLILDGIAAITFLQKNNGISHFFSVAKAHFSFYYKIFDLIKKRRNIKQMKNLTAKMPWSILLKNKIQGIKIFSKLN